MVRKITLAGLFFTLSLPCFMMAQTLDGAPYTPGKDPDISMYMTNWKDSAPKNTYGALTEQAIMTRGNAMKPPARGAVLEYCNRFSHASLASNASTGPVTLKGEQEVYYILSGKGTIKAGKKTIDLYEGICMLIPSNLTFTMTNTGTETLTLYLVNEPIPQGFRPNKELLVRDENTMPIDSTNGHWCHIVKTFFETSAGLGTLERVLTVSLDPMTIAHPHSHDPGCEEAWTEISGTSIAFIGKQIFMQPEGVGYMIPPNGNTPHANINTSDKPIKMFYFARYKDHDLRK
ncbi:MAG: cupin domain-containing protein [Candidatus Latescibacterota bacterium]